MSATVLLRSTSSPDMVPNGSAASWLWARTSSKVWSLPVLYWMIAASPLDVGEIELLKMYRLGLATVPSCRLAVRGQTPAVQALGISSNQVETVRPLELPVVCCVHTPSAPPAPGSLR